MSEEAVIKDGTIYFNSKRKPTVVYHDIGAKTTGLEYKSKNISPEISSPSSTTWKILVSLCSFFAMASIVGVVYIAVVKFWGKGKTKSTDPNEIVLDVEPAEKRITMSNYYGAIYKGTMLNINEKETKNEDTSPLPTGKLGKSC